MPGHASNLNDSSCVSPTMVATVSDQVTATTRRALEPEISTADVEAVLNTVIALESGRGPKPATTTADYYSQVARLSGRSYYVVSTVLPAYIATLSGMPTTDASKDSATATKDATTTGSTQGTSEAKATTAAATGTGGSITNGTTTGSRSGILFAIGGLLGLIALVAYVAKRGQS